MVDWCLLPIPRNLQNRSDSYLLSAAKFISLNRATPQNLLLAEDFQKALLSHAGLKWEITASPCTPDDQVGLALKIGAPPINHPQGYDLIITSQGIQIRAETEVGLYYGVCTLKQILSAHTTRDLPYMPGVEIQDWPDFSTRGVMIDISRNKVPTLDTLLNLVDLLASWKINQLQLYTEHTFAYHKHPEVWVKASPLTGEDILKLDRYCQEHFIELVPNQNSFGHMHRWLRIPQYAHLGEIYEGVHENWWGKGSFSLCPIDPGSIELLEGLYDELLPHFSSKMFNVGCDETFDLGSGRSRDMCEKIGKGRVYFDFLLKIYEAVNKRGRAMQFWGDIILQYPELVPYLPKDILALEWGYEASHPFDERCAHFAESGIPFYVCPGTSSWNAIAGRVDNALGNLKNAAEQGIKHNASGYLITDWGDNGHWQMLPFSYPGFAAGAAYAWCMEANHEISLPLALSQYAYQDSSAVMGKMVYDIGNVYQATGILIENASILFRILQTPVDKLRENKRLVNPEDFRKTLISIDQIMSSLEQTQPQGHDASILKDELSLTASLLSHACKRALFVLKPDKMNRVDLLHEIDGIIENYQCLWLLRNRPGGLVDSLARFEISRLDYVG